MTNIYKHLTSNLNSTSEFSGAFLTTNKSFPEKTRMMISRTQNNSVLGRWQTWEQNCSKTRRLATH